MTTTTTTSTSKRSEASSLAASAKFGTFAIVFGISFSIIYLVCELFSLPLFTYHPATNRFDFGWAPGRSGEGPAMYWYGWVAMCLIVSPILGWLATYLPESVTKKIPLWLLWLLPIIAFIPLVWSLRPFWEKGGWW